MNKVKIIGKNTKNIKNILDKIIPNLEKRLKISVDFPVTIRLHDTRKSYDKQLGRSTYNWEVGNTSTNNNYLDIIHQDSFEKYSSHPKDDFLKILKHELSHIYIKGIVQKNTIPTWLNEGLAMYLADQTTQYEKRGFFIENNYLSKISTEYGWNKYSNYSAYDYACLFVGYLVKRYSLNKIIELLKKLKLNYSYNTFDKIFTDIFDKNLEMVEKDFVGSLK